MRLPDDSVGISDILDYRECPQRFAHSMRRHMDMPERFKLEDGEKAEPPEKRNWTNAYGSAIHDVIQVVEEQQCSDDAAIDQVWVEWQSHLEPDDIDRMRQDLETYHTRTALGYRLIGSEIELRVPLMVFEGRTIYFRGRIDALYQHMQNPGVFLSRDYKSSKWPKSQEEIQKDLQQWAYNWAIHEFWPECQTLVQMYDQLRFGDWPIRKSDTQRRQIQEWLVKQVTAILTDPVMKPTMNEWCWTCPIMLDCRVTHLAADWWKNRLEALAPEEKQGRKTVVKLDKEEEGDFSKYTDILPQVKQSQKMLERFTKAVEEALKQMPAERRAEFGYDLTKPKVRESFDAQGLRQIHEMIGDDFFHLAGISKSAVEEFYGKNSEEYDRITSLAEQRQGAPSLKRTKSG